MKLELVAGSENYKAKVVKISEYKKHPNADKLFIITVDFQNVITGEEPELGSLAVYFPVMSKINLEFLRAINGFAHSNLNENIEVRGFFGDNGRVRPIKLRGIPSEGYLHPIQDVQEFLKVKLHEGDEFNSAGGRILCEKYTIKASGENNAKDRIGRSPRISRLIDNQFKLHNDTENLRRNIQKLSPEDLIEISYKKHGCNFTVGNLLTKRKLPWYEKLLNKIGVKVLDRQYDYVYGSRRVVKNEYETQESKHFYGVDIWSLAKDKLKESIPKGYTLYCEIVGQTPTGEWIQKEYDYGTKEKEFKVFVFKITCTNVDGFTINLSPNQIRQFCDKFGLEYSSTLFYYGRARDLFPISTTGHWHQNFLSELEKRYTEKTCHLCVNKVPEEGIVLVREDLFSYDAFKLKSFKFLEREDKQLENNETNIEDE